jgi:hypothetical protein
VEPREIAAWVGSSGSGTLEGAGWGVRRWAHDEADVVVGEAGRGCKDASLARRAEVEAHPEAALREVEVPAKLRGLALGRVPCCKVRARPVVHVHVAHARVVKGAARAGRAALVAPWRTHTHLLGDPRGETLAVRVVVRPDELVEHRVGERLFVEEQREAPQHR